MPIWAVKRTGDDKGVYRIYKGTSKTAIRSNMEISLFSLYYRMAGIIKKEKVFGYSTFRKFDEVDNLHQDMKRNLIVMILENS